MATVEIESWLGENDIWYAHCWLGKLVNVPVKGRGGTREEAVAEVETRIAQYLEYHRSRDESFQVHTVEIIPEGAGVRVLEEEESGEEEEEGDNET